MRETEEMQRRVITEGEGEKRQRSESELIKISRERNRGRRNFIEQGVSRLPGP